MNKELTFREEYFGYLVYDNQTAWYRLVTDKKIIEAINTMGESECSKKLVINYIENKSINTNNVAVRVLREVKKNRLSAPLEMYFDYTNDCNLKCPPCYNRENLNSQTMSKDSISRIIDEMYQLGIMRLHLAGGEPIYHEDLFFHYIDTARENGIVTSMATNGTLITKDIAEALVEKDLYAVSVSLDGFDEESNKKIRGCNNFYTATEGVRNLVNAKKRINSKTDICLKPMFLPDTPIIFFEKMIVMAIDLGVDKIKFSNPERSVYHEKGYWAANKNLYYSQMKALGDLKHKYRKNIRIDVINNPCNHIYTIGIPNQQGCIGGNELLTINPNGDITPCLMHKRILGNYFEAGSIRHFIEETNTLTEYLDELKSNITCADCHLLARCRGGCQVRKVVDYGHLSLPDPLCPLQESGEMGVGTREYTLVDEILEDDKICVFHSL